MKIIYKTENGKLVHGDNIEVMKKIKENSVDSCISDFPYNLSFMGKKWDTTGNFYDWCKNRAIELHRIIKPGGYVCIFGHPKTNHRMKCAFEDVGFQVVEEIDWVYGTGFPKNQDIAKMYDKLTRGCPQGKSDPQSKMHGKWNSGCTEENEDGRSYGAGASQWGNIDKNEKYTPDSDQAKKWDGWKTSGLKPAHEPITVFQKPLEGTYIQNIERYSCGAMNIESCRIGFSENDDPRIGKEYKHHAKAGLENGSHKDNSSGELLSLHNSEGRFPANVIFDTYMSEELDSQSGISISKKSMRGVGLTDSLVYGSGDANFDTMRGHNDSGGASRYFLKIEKEDFVPFFYCPKPSKKEKGENNTHVTVKPKQLIKWLIKLVTPLDGKTIDITAGSGTHGLACEELNKEENYNLKWIDVELLNTEKEPYCEIAMNRIKMII